MVSQFGHPLLDLNISLVKKCLSNNNKSIVNHMYLLFAIFYCMVIYPPPPCFLGVSLCKIVDNSWLHHIIPCDAANILPYFLPRYIQQNRIIKIHGEQIFYLLS